MKNRSKFFVVLQLFAMLLNITTPLLSSFPLGVSVARADDYDSICSAANITASNTAVANPSATPAKAGDNLSAYCAQWKLSKAAKKVGLTELVVETVAAAVATTMAVADNIPWITAEGKLVCMGLNLAVPASTMLMDKNNAMKNAQTVGKFVAGASQIVGAFGLASTAIMGAMQQQGSAAATAAMTAATASDQAATTAVQTQDAAAGCAPSTGSVTTATDAAKAAEKTKQRKSTCVATAVMLGLQAGIAGVGIGVAGKTERIAREAAEGFSAQNGQNVGGTYNMTTTGGSAGGMTVPASESGLSASNGGTTASSSCDQKSGDSFLTCVKPEFSAITSGTQAGQLLQNALGGQPLGDFAKGFQGDNPADVAAYVAKGLNMGPNGASALAKLSDLQNEIAGDLGPQVAYRSVASKASVAPDMDFGKVMSDMLKQLNPDAAKAAPKDPSELVFRQLDLLPADKIEKNRDISLFARIGYRYRKNLSNVEQLNWSEEENRR